MLTREDQTIMLAITFSMRKAIGSLTHEQAREQAAAKLQAQGLEPSERNIDLIIRAIIHYS